MKTIFTNKIFFYLLISFISLLLLWSIYNLIITRSIWAVSPILFQTIIIILILTGNQYAKIAVIAWAIIVFIIAQIFGLIALVLDLINEYIDNTPKAINISDSIYKLIMLVIGVLIVDYTRRTVKVERPVINEIEDQ
jgi:hypothetical protein